MRFRGWVFGAVVLTGCSEYGVNSHPGTGDTGVGPIDDTDTVGPMPEAVCGVLPPTVALPMAEALFAGGDSYDPGGMPVSIFEWSFTSIPNGSAVAMPLGNGANRVVVPDKPGEYVAQLIVGTEDGRTSDPCFATLTVTPDPDAVDPVAICSVNPEEVAPPFEDATFIGIDSYDPEGMDIDEYEWSFVSVPDGSSVSMPWGISANRTVTPDVAGDYVGRLIVHTEDGRESEPCFALLTAVPEENLWVEMFWEHTGDDMDLHLLAPGGVPRTGTDCYYGNCTYGGLNWGASGSADNPSLDIDDISGDGPENISIAQPQDGVFTVFVHDFPGSVYNGTNNVTVNIYVDGHLEWTDVRNISVEDSDIYYATIDWPSAVITGM